MKKNAEEEISDDEEKPEEPQAFLGASSGIDTKNRYFIGKDYSNLYEKPFEELEKHNEGNSFFRSIIYPLF